MGEPWKEGKTGFEGNKTIFFLVPEISDLVTKVFNLKEDIFSWEDIIVPILRHFILKFGTHWSRRGCRSRPLSTLAPSPLHYSRRAIALSLSFFWCVSREWFKSSWKSLKIFCQNFTRAKKISPVLVKHYDNFMQCLSFKVKVEYWFPR